MKSTNLSMLFLSFKFKFGSLFLLEVIDVVGAESKSIKRLNEP